MIGQLNKLKDMDEKYTQAQKMMHIEIQIKYFVYQTNIHIYRQEITNRKDKEIVELKNKLTNLKRILLDSKAYDKFRRQLKYDFVPISSKTLDNSENSKNNMKKNLKPRYSIAKE